MEWYYEYQGAQNGPVSESEIQQLVAGGQLNGSSRVWNQSLSDWTALQTAAPHLAPQQAAASAPSQNPYATPQNYGGGAVTSYDQGERLPGFAKGWMITDIVFCSLRLIAVLAGVAGLAVIEQLGNDDLYNAAALEVFSGLIIFLAGLPAAILVLNKKSAGIIFGWITVAATVASMLITFWVLSLTSQLGARMVGPAAAGHTAGVFLGVMIRAGLLVCYCIALVQAGKFISAQKYQSAMRRH